MSVCLFVVCSIHFSSPQNQSACSSTSTFSRARSDDVATKPPAPSASAKVSVSNLAMSLEESLLSSNSAPFVQSTSFCDGIALPPTATTTAATLFAETNSGREHHQRRRVSTDGELSRYQWCLQKVVAEKRELDAELEHCRNQLVAVSPPKTVDGHQITLPSPQFRNSVPTRAQGGNCTCSRSIANASQLSHLRSRRGTRNCDQKESLPPSKALSIS